jgi:hypothetical protein
MQFRWRPYLHQYCQQMIPGNFVEPSWRSTCPLICFEILCWHPANRVRRQFGLVQPPPTQPRNLGRSHNRDLGKSGNWEENHSDWITLWNRRRNSIEAGGDTLTYVMSDEYWAWYSNDLARGVLYLSAGLRNNDPNNVELPPRFAIPWHAQFEQLPAHLLSDAPPYPGHLDVPVVHDAVEEEEGGGDDDDEDDGEEEDEVEEEVLVPTQPPIYGEVLQRMGLIDIQWDNWATLEQQPPAHYVGWDRVDYPGQQYQPQPDMFGNQQEQQFGYAEQQGLGFGADFQGFFTPGQSTNIAESSQAGARRQRGQRRQRERQGGDRYNMRTDLPPNEQSPYMYPPP